MRALDRKLLRDVSQLKGQVIAVALVVASGVAGLLGALTTQDSLARAQSEYYERYRFAQVFAHCVRAPDSIARELAASDDVALVEPRIVVDVTLGVRGLAEPAVGRLISIPAAGESALNRLHVRRGRLLEPGRPDEVLVNEAFAQTHGFHPGDTVTAILNGRWRVLRIVGVALSPEHVYQIKGDAIFPDEKRFGVFWIDRDTLAAAYDMKGAFNDVTATLRPGASEESVLRHFDRTLERYGGLGAFGRHHQLSHRYVTDEFRQLGAMALLLPAILFSVAAFLLHVVISRLVGTQRTQIALLKAFGYTNREIALHFLELVWLIVAFGSVLGIAVGVWFGRGMTSNYFDRFFRFAEPEYRIGIEVVALSIGIGFVTSTLGALGAVRRAVRLPPAEAMRPEPPGSFHASWIERIGLRRLLSPPARMIVREISRRPLRATLATTGIAFASAILIVGFFFQDAMNRMIQVQFKTASREDIAVVFRDPQSARARHELERLPGVVRSEPFRAVAARVRSGARSYRTSVVGLERGAQLRRVVDRKLRLIDIPDDGILLTKALGEILGVAAGDVVSVEVLEGARPVLDLPVRGLVDELIGVTGYMDERALNRALREGGTISGAYLEVDSTHLGDTYARLEALPKVGSVAVNKAALASFEKTVAEMLLTFTTALVAFAVTIAFGVVYNNTHVSLAERTRELATLRVLGFTPREVSFVLLGELAVVALLGIPIGCVLGYAIAHATSVFVFSTELYRIPFVVAPSTIAFAATVVLVAVTVSGLIVRRRVDRLDLVAVLKAAE